MKDSLKAMLCVLFGAMVPMNAIGQQSTASLTQTVNQRNTLGQLTASPMTGSVVGSPINFNLLLTTGGAPAPVSEAVQFYDGTTQLGSPALITSIPASNLLPNSNVDTGTGWASVGAAPVITPHAASGADGGANNATTIAFPGAGSGVMLAVPGSTSYAGSPMTFSFWMLSTSGAPLQIGISDSPHVSASGVNTCTPVSTWQMCTLTYTFPQDAGTGFEVSITSSSAQVISVSLPDVVQSAHPGGYVSTIGVARPTGGEAGNAIFDWANFLAGPHTITAQYAGDQNFIGSTSNAISFAVNKGTPAVAVVDDPAGTSVYGQAVTLTATVTGPVTTPTGSVTFMDGALSLGTATLNSSGGATITRVGAASLPAGTHTITAVYNSDGNFVSVTSAAITHVVTKAEATVTIASSLNPAIYGDTVTYSINVSSPVGIQPTGTVLVVDGGTVTLDNPTVDASGNAQVVVTTFTAGTHNIVATYSGDSNYQ